MEYPTPNITYQFMMIKKKRNTAQFIEIADALRRFPPYRVVLPILVSVVVSELYSPGFFHDPRISLSDVVGIDPDVRIRKTFTNGS